MRAMDITLEFHIEAVGEGVVSWWAESNDLPGVTVAADSLLELRELIDQMLSDLSEDRDEPIVVIAEHLSGEDDEYDEPSVEVQRDVPDGTTVSGAGAPARILIPA